MGFKIRPNICIRSELSYLTNDDYRILFLSPYLKSHGFLYKILIQMRSLSTDWAIWIWVLSLFHSITICIETWTCYITIVPLLISWWVIVCNTTWSFQASHSVWPSWVIVAQQQCLLATSTNWSQLLLCQHTCSQWNIQCFHSVWSFFTCNLQDAQVIKVFVMSYLVGMLVFLFIFWVKMVGISLSF